MWCLQSVVLPKMHLYYLSGDYKHKVTHSSFSVRDDGLPAQDNSQQLLKCSLFSLPADESDSGVGLCGWLLTAISWALVMVTLPFSLCVCFKVRERLQLQTYLRLGRDALLCEQGRKREQASIDIFYFSFLSITFYLDIH